MFYFRLFQDGIDWGKVAALLEFAYLIIVKAAKRNVDNLPWLVRLVVRFVGRIVQDKLAKWIAEKGGWVSKRYIAMV